MVIYGKQTALHLLINHPKKVEIVYLYLKNNKKNIPQELFHQFHDKIKFIEEKWANSMSKGGNHQGILVETTPFKESSFEELKEESFLLILDGLTDVGNIGAIVRSAYSLGVDGILVTGVKQLNFSAIARASSGALFDMPIHISSNILDQLNELKQKNFKIYGASMEGEDIKNIEEFENKRVLILGGEDKGISKKVRSKLDTTISIKMKKEFNSLNVSVAGGILIHTMSK